MALGAKTRKNLLVKVLREFEELTFNCRIINRNKCPDSNFLFDDDSMLRELGQTSQSDEVNDLKLQVTTGSKRHSGARIHGGASERTCCLIF